mmetsp:Transcript_3804/g.5910  ORF Transcript_3804/g.5910 Transcript_3804/m.5910 type:complete len:603 (-) Transcript_3804:202-2010(-)
MLHISRRLRFQQLHYPIQSKSFSSIVSFKDVSFEYNANKPVICNGSFSIEEGSKVTIMGQNGSGKSTMLKLMTGELRPDMGSINIHSSVKVAAAKQIMSKELTQLSVRDFFIHHAPYLEDGIEREIYKTLDTVELTAPLDRKIHTFSGGQQARLLLAAALIQDPDLLLLDEPTNNLDHSGINNLTDFMWGFHKTVIVISHDEEFLNSFTDSVLYLDSWTHKIESYDGNYNDVKRDIARRIEKENQANARLAKAAQQKKDQANKFKDKGGGMRKVAKKMREDAARMEEAQVAVRREDKPLKPFTIPCQFGVSGDVLDLSAVSLPSVQGGGLKVIPLQFPLQMQRGMRLQLQGPNGIGKTTLLQNIVEGRIEGCQVQGGVRVGYYRQDFSTLNFSHTVLESLREVCDITTPEETIRRTAASFMLTGPIVHQTIDTLSEGQKGLCSLARLVLQEPGLLILDEPTNHINFRHLPAIAQALNEYQGAMILVSHDRAFVEKVQVDKVLNLGDEMERFTAWLKSQEEKEPVKKSKAEKVSAEPSAETIKETKSNDEAADQFVGALLGSYAALRLERSGLKRPNIVVKAPVIKKRQAVRTPKETSAVETL